MWGESPRTISLFSGACWRSSRGVGTLGAGGKTRRNFSCAELWDRRDANCIRLNFNHMWKKEMHKFKVNWRSKQQLIIAKRSKDYKVNNDGYPFRGSALSLLEEKWRCFDCWVRSPITQDTQSGVMVGGWPVARSTWNLLESFGTFHRVLPHWPEGIVKVRTERVGETQTPTKSQQGETLKLKFDI